MATAALIRSIRRHHVVSAPLSAYRLQAASGEPLSGSSYIGQNYGSLCRIFSSKPVSSDFIGTGLGSANTRDATWDRKNPKAFENVAGAQITPSFEAFTKRTELLLGTPSFGTRRLFTTKSDDPKTQEEQYAPKIQSFRPLSPHLPVYQPQKNAMLSIFNRISAVYLTGIILGGALLFLDMGLICLTYPSFYQFLFYVSKQIPFFISLTAIATIYHLGKGTYTLVAHAKPFFPKLFR